MRRSLKTLAFVLMCHCPTHLLAQPANPESKKPTIVDTGSRYYEVEHIDLPSQDIPNKYRIHLLRPRQPAPVQGYPVLYLLDGNAVLEDIDDNMLARIADNTPPVLVTIGYETTRRFDTTARAYDYTPRISDQGHEFDPLSPQRRTGGADDFFRFLEKTVKPAVAQNLPINPRHQGIWGHSYGGLFVLHVLFTQPDSFQCYAAASPSLWWQKGHILEQESKETEESPSPSLAVLVTYGSIETKPEAPSSDPSLSAARLARASVPPEAAKEMVKRLGKIPGTRATYHEFPGIGHGQAFTASIETPMQWFKTCSSAVPPDFTSFSQKVSPATALAPK